LEELVVTTTATDLFVEEFAKDRCFYATIKGKMAAIGIVPQDVDINDARVQSVLQLCKQQNKEKSN
jgi:hypothetical protein